MTKDGKGKPKKYLPVSPNGNMQAANLGKVYAGLRATLKSACWEAERLGKKPLIVIGDCHNSDEALVMEFMILDIMKELRPRDRNYFVEGAAEVINHAVSTSSVPDSALKNPLFSAIFAGRTLGYTIHPVEHDEINREMAEIYRTNPTAAEFNAVLERALKDRDTAMAQKIQAQMPKSGVLLCGTTHIKGIIENLKNSGNNSHITVFDLSPTNIMEHFQDASTPLLNAAMQQVRSDEKAIKLPVTDMGNPRVDSQALVKLTAAALAYYNRNLKEKS